MEYIYLHGFLSGPDSQKGRFLAAKFAEAGYHLHRPDLNGGDFEHLTISRQMDTIRQLTDSLKKPVVLIGSSLGGYLAALNAESNRLVHRLVLMAPSFGFAERYLKLFSSAELENWQREGFIKFYHYQLQRNCRLSADIIADARQFAGRKLERQVPTLLFHGIRDDSVPYQLSIDHLAGHPMADLVLLNSDHSLLDRLEDIWEYTRNFLHL